MNHYNPCKLYRAVSAALKSFKQENKRTWKGRGCSLRGPWSWYHSQQSQRKLSPVSGKTCRWARTQTKTLRKVKSHTRVSILTINLNFLLYEVGISIEFATMLQASGPGKNAGNGVGAGRPSLRSTVKDNVSFLTTRPMFFHIILNADHQLYYQYWASEYFLLSGFTTWWQYSFTDLYFLFATPSLGLSYFLFCYPAKMLSNTSLTEQLVTNLLVLTVVPGHSAMGSLSLNSLAIRAHENWCHQAQRAKTYNGKYTKCFFSATHNCSETGKTFKHL